MSVIGNCRSGTARPGKLRVELALAVTAGFTGQFRPSADRREVLEFVCRAVGAVSAIFTRGVDVEFLVKFIPIWMTNPTVPPPSGRQHNTPQNFQDYWRLSLGITSAMPSSAFGPVGRAGRT